MASIGSPKWRLCHDRPRARPNYRVENVHTPHAVGQAIGEVVPLRRGSRSSDENCRGKSKQTVHHQKLRQLNEIQMKNE